ncbi:MAG: hypothetical protein ABIS84_02745 [Arachnia sp.]
MERISGDAYNLTSSGQWSIDAETSAPRTPLFAIADALMIAAAVVACCCRHHRW